MERRYTIETNQFGFSYQYPLSDAKGALKLYERFSTLEPRIVEVSTTLKSVNGSGNLRIVTYRTVSLKRLKRISASAR